MKADPGPLTRPDAQAGQNLCLECGLCCTGVWFSNVNLEPHEVAPAQQAGMQVDTIDDKSHSHQPCPLHCNGRCTGYEVWRPSACVGFECALLADLNEGKLTLEGALFHVNSARAMADRVRAELGQVEGGLLGPRFLTRLGGLTAPDKSIPMAPASSPSTQLDAFALNVYYKKYFLKAETPPQTLPAASPFDSV